jgi:hypothetical protein
MTDLMTVPPEELNRLSAAANADLFEAEDVAKVTDLTTEARAAEFRARIKGRLKDIEGKRTQYTGPLNEVIRSINADFKRVSDPLNKAVEIVDGGIKEFRMAEDFREKEELRKRAEAEASAAIHDVQRTMTPKTVATAQEKGDAYLAANAEAPKSVATQTGSMTGRRPWKHEILDEDAVPREFCSPDPKKLTAAVKAGAREIPGCRIFEDFTVVTRLKR